MTIASEITRLQWAKADIKTAIENKWVTVPSSAKLDTYDTYIDQISSTEQPPLSITWAISYGGLVNITAANSVGGILWCASYTTNNLVLVWYIWTYTTQTGYDYADVHFIRRKPWVDYVVSWWTAWYNYGEFEQYECCITKENDWASYLFTTKSTYKSTWAEKKWMRCQIRYTVATDTFTTLTKSELVDAYTDPWADIVNDDMHLYTADYEIGGTSRVALFNYQNN